MSGKAREALIPHPFSIGSVSAVCRHCGCRSFTVASALVLACASCGAETTREELLQQVCDAVVQSAALALLRARAAREAAHAAEGAVAE